MEQANNTPEIIKESDLLNFINVKYAKAKIPKVKKANTKGALGKNLKKMSSIIKVQHKKTSHWKDLAIPNHFFRSAEILISSHQEAINIAANG